MGLGVLAVSAECRCRDKDEVSPNGGGGEARAPRNVATQRPRQTLGLAGGTSEFLGEDAVFLPENLAEGAIGFGITVL